MSQTTGPAVVAESKSAPIVEVSTRKVNPLVQALGLRGTNDAANLYWDNAQAVWNSTDDTVILRYA
jgi:hypothetical protein